MFSETTVFFYFTIFLLSKNLPFHDAMYISSSSYIFFTLLSLLWLCNPKDRLFGLSIMYLFLRNGEEKEKRAFIES